MPSKFPLSLISSILGLIVAVAGIVYFVEDRYLGPKDLDELKSEHKRIEREQTRGLDKAEYLLRMEGAREKKELAKSLMDLHESVRPLIPEIWMDDFLKNQTSAERIYTEALQEESDLRKKLKEIISN